MSVLNKYVKVNDFEELNAAVKWLEARQEVTGWAKSLSMSARDLLDIIRINIGSPL